MVQGLIIHPHGKAIKNTQCKERKMNIKKTIFAHSVILINDQFIPNLTQNAHFLKPCSGPKQHKK